jgi:hypothetical protein
VKPGLSAFPWLLGGWSGGAGRSIDLRARVVAAIDAGQT